MIPTKLLIYQLRIALKLETWYQINAKTYFSYSIIRYANYLIYICMIINPNIRNKRKIAKNKGLCLQNYSNLSFQLP